MIKPIFCLFALGLLTGVSRAQKNDSGYPPEVPKATFSEVSYGQHERNVLDFWKAKSKSPTPVAFVIHGGGWKGGSKERLPRFADPNALLNAGISVVAINYRYVTSTEKPPVKAPLHDAARALQFVRSKAKEWNIDKERIGAAGGVRGRWYRPVGPSFRCRCSPWRRPFCSPPLLRRSASASRYAPCCPTPCTHPHRPVLWSVHQLVLRRGRRLPRTGLGGPRTKRPGTARVCSGVRAIAALAGAGQVLQHRGE